MRRTFPKSCYFHFLSFQKTVFINFILFNFILGNMHFTVSPGLIVHKNLDYFRSYFFSSVRL